MSASSALRHRHPGGFLPDRQWRARHSHAIGTGGRDLSAEVGGITTLDGDRSPRSRTRDPDVV
jgi:hypothetical protein